MGLTPLEREKRAKMIIHGASVASAATAGALAQGATLGLDTPFLTVITVGMVIALGELFDQKTNKSTALAILGQAAGAGVGVAGAKALLGWFPGIGNLANAIITTIYTEGLGWWVYKYFTKKTAT
ncbi:hypothetical protein [Candidatus Magnetominusculus xianensis]|uniref:DUF697 domain-containing protein n=1 Tax=Candidatus Magnetominusculus xianensis TaxID=1748249 RepID=A0ABR5SGX4_9BACT|nr:hypothetical protein [Candidatus Magnetominusculus xianensis]KWT90912.1 hypothetical protein ASN18_0995 [Candidatus Magnetominusculus xianensis]MBF0403067.1 hypothetical protein [Nitrospirota bacterium]